MKNRLIIILTLSLSVSILSGCFADAPTTRDNTTTAQGTQGETIPDGTQGSTAQETIAQGTTTPDTIAPATTTPDTIAPATTTSETKPETQPQTKPATKPETKPQTTPKETKPEATKPEETKPEDTKPKETKPQGEYSGISNEREAWSYGYPTKWVNDYSGYWKYGNSDLYLTLDLGYEMGYTHEILDTFQEKNVKATFFLTTEYILNHPSNVQRMLAEGHQIGNHSTKHINMVKLVGTDGVELRENTEKWEKAFKDLTGKTSHLYRAPEGVFSKRGMTVLEEMGYDTIFWGAAYADWDDKNQPTIEEAKAKLYPYIDGGDVVLLHPFETNAKLMPEFIDDMRAKGYSFKLVP